MEMKEKLQAFVRALQPPNEMFPKMDFSGALKKRWLFNNAVSTIRLFSVDEIGDSETVFGEMRSRIRHRLPRIHLTAGENLRKNPTRSQVEACSKCEKLKSKLNSDSLNETAKKAAAAELMVHTRKYKKFYSNLSEIKKKCQNENVMRLSIDYAKHPIISNTSTGSILLYKLQTVAYEIIQAGAQYDRERVSECHDNFCC
ncbi:hypothetical protein ANN_22595 [Periplaneta americana]|uniref:Uncharacterized protein n=1 Tax=Periplaneta americana TaxID=6978 RepID=A0ABQ8S8J5_PERAM|nr:hypothetical protein ANN_22595 [Periplaneta americana]